MLVHLRDGGEGGAGVVAATAATTPLVKTADNKTCELSCGATGGGEWW